MEVRRMDNLKTEPMEPYWLHREDDGRYLAIILDDGGYLTLVGGDEEVGAGTQLRMRADVAFIVARELKNAAQDTLAVMR